MIALAGTRRALHLAQQRIHLIDREAAIRTHRAVARHGGQQIVDQLLQDK